MSNSISQKFNTKTLIKFALPAIVMMVLCSLFSMTGTIFAAKYINQDAMSAINLVFPTVTVVIATAVMYSTGANAIITKNLGEGKLQEARENFTSLIIIGVITGLILTIIVLSFDDQIIDFLGSTESLNVYSKTYLRTFTIFFVFVFLEIYSQYFYVAIGKPILGLIIIIISGIFTVLTNYILVAVLKIGIAGAAIASGVGFIIPAIIFIVYFLVKKDNSLYFVKPKYHKHFLSKMCSNGSSEMVSNLAVAVIATVMNLIMIKLAGKNGLAASSVISQVKFLLNSLYIGFGAGIAPIFGFAYGCNNHKQTKTVFKISLKFVLISSAVVVLISLLLRNQVVSLFVSPDSSAYSLAVKGFSIFSMGYFFAGFNIFASVFFTSVSNGKVSAIISFLRTFIFVLGMLFILPKFYGVMGVFWAIPVAETMGALVSLYFVRKYKNIYHY